MPVRKKANRDQRRSQNQQKSIQENAKRLEEVITDVWHYCFHDIPLATIKVILIFKKIAMPSMKACNFV